MPNALLIFLQRIVVVSTIFGGVGIQQLACLIRARKLCYCCLEL